MHGRAAARAPRAEASGCAQRRARSRAANRQGGRRSARLPPASSSSNLGSIAAPRATKRSHRLRRRQRRNRVLVLAAHAQRHTRRSQARAGGERSQAGAPAAALRRPRAARGCRARAGPRSPQAAARLRARPPTPSACPIVGTISSASRMLERSTNAAPPRTSGARCSAIARASRVFPVPPGPVSVTSRTSSRRRIASTAVSSSRRPTSAVGAAAAEAAAPRRAPRVRAPDRG